MHAQTSLSSAGTSAEGTRRGAGVARGRPACGESIESLEVFQVSREGGGRGEGGASFVSFLFSSSAYPVGGGALAAAAVVTDPPECKWDTCVVVQKGAQWGAVRWVVVWWW